MARSVRHQNQKNGHFFTFLFVNKMFFKIAQFMMANLVPFLKSRVRIHPGKKARKFASPLELPYDRSLKQCPFLDLPGSSRNEYLESLKTFGIPVDVIPESSRDVRKHRADWKRRQTLERKRRDSAILSSPHNGKQMNNHFAVIMTPRPMESGCVLAVASAAHLGCHAYSVAGRAM